MSEIFNEQIEYFRSRIDFSGKKEGQAFTIFTKMFELQYYFSQFGNGQIDYKTYIRLRKDHKNINRLISAYSNLIPKQFVQEDLLALSTPIEEIEKDILTRLIGQE